jgi:hypothetical protein
VSLDARQALRSGYDDLTSEAGLNVLSVLLVFNVAYGAVSQSFRQRLLAGVSSGRTGLRFPPPFGVDVLAFEFPLGVLAALTVAVVVADEAVRFWAIQQFAGRPAPTLQERGRLLVAVGGGVALFVYGVREGFPFVWAHQGFGVSMGAAVAVAPVLLVTGYHRQEIALTAAGPVETVRNSIGRFLDAPVPVAGLLVLLFLLGQFSLLPSAVLSRVVTVRAGSTLSVLLEVLNRALFAALSTFSIAAITDAYL